MTTSTATRLATTLVAILAASLLLHYGRVVLIPIVLSVLLSYALSPVVGFLHRAGLPRLVATCLVMLCFIGGLAISAYSLRYQALAAIEEVPAFARRLREEMRAGAAGGGLLEKVRRAGTEIERTSRELAAQPGAANAPVAPPITADGLFVATTAGVIALAGHATAIFFLVFFMLLSDDLFERKLLAIAGPSRREIVRDALAEITVEIQRYLWVRIITSVAVALATWAALSWLGMSNAILWGIAAGICNVIPYVGPVIISAGLLIAGFVHYGSIGEAALVSAVALVISALEGWLLEPPLMGKAEGLNTVAILVGLVYWTWAWGAWGTVLAVPLLSVIKTVCSRTTGLRPVAELLRE
jgi:predicted PurR-regulated permease PerM